MLEVKHFPSDMSALEIDRADAKSCLISGLFEETVKVGDVQRRFYVTMQDNIYAVGVGGGAAVAQQAAMEMASEWSGLATLER